MKTAKNKMTTHKGSVLILVIVTMVLMMMIGMTLLSLGSNARIKAIRACSDIRAKCAADAGLAKAVAALNQQHADGSLDDYDLPAESSVSVENCAAAFSYTITRSGSDYIAASTGTAGQRQKQVSCTLTPRGPFSCAVFNKKFAWFGSGCTVDQYNTTSSTPPLTISTTNTAKGSITIGPSAQINGDVSVGVRGDPADAISNRGTIAGEQYAMTERVSMDPVTVPDSLDSMTSQGILSSGEITASGKYSGIDVPNSGTVIIKGPVALYVTGGVNLGRGAQIIVDNTNPDSSLMLYIGDDFSGDNSSSINNLTQNPQKLQIFGLDSCGAVNIKNGAAFYGAIYAPEAAVEFYNATDVYGAVVSKYFALAAGTAFHYDASLRDAATNNSLVKYIIQRWREN